ncbi:MAG: GerMN domain-containing protein [bacterium]
MKYFYWTLTIIVIAILGYGYTLNPGGDKKAETNSPAPRPTREVVVYLSKNDANKIVPVAVSRLVVGKTDAEVALAALRELVKGPTLAEIDQGYLTAIPDGVVVNSVSIEGDTAIADFNDKLDTPTSGAPLITTIIHDQIVGTLQQFAKQVKITIGGSRKAKL